MGSFSDLGKKLFSKKRRRKELDQKEPFTRPEKSDRAKAYEAALKKKDEKEAKLKKYYEDYNKKSKSKKEDKKNKYAHGGTKYSKLKELLRKKK